MRDVTGDQKANPPGFCQVRECATLSIYYISTHILQ